MTTTSDNSVVKLGQLKTFKDNLDAMNWAHIFVDTDAGKMPSDDAVKCNSAWPNVALVDGYGIWYFPQHGNGSGGYTAPHTFIGYDGSNFKTVTVDLAGNITLDTVNIADSYTLPIASARTLGGVKLSDATDSTSAAGDGIAATPKAVNAVVTALDGYLPKNGTAIKAKTLTSGAVGDRSHPVYFSAAGIPQPIAEIDGTIVGQASAESRGSVVLFDNAVAELDSKTGVAATPKAVSVLNDKINTNTNSIAKETTDRQAAIAAEKKAREDADAKLTSSCEANATAIARIGSLKYGTSDFVQVDTSGNYSSPALSAISSSISAIPVIAMHEIVFPTPLEQSGTGNTGHVSVKYADNPSAKAAMDAYRSAVMAGRVIACGFICNFSAPTDTKYKDKGYLPINKGTMSAFTYEGVVSAEAPGEAPQYYNWAKGAYIKLDLSSSAQVELSYSTESKGEALSTISNYLYSVLGFYWVGF